MKPFSIDFETEVPFPKALEVVKASLKEEGFGTLSEIDVQATLLERIAAHIEPYTILGVCNPVLANKALAVEPKIGVFLPCTVVVRAEGGRVRIHAQDPALMEEIVGQPALTEMALEVRTRIANALQATALRA